MGEISRKIADSILSGSLVVGSKETLEAIKSDKAKEVVISSSCPPEIRDLIMNRASSVKIPIHVFKGTSVGLGSLCQKPFRVAALAILSPIKEKKVRRPKRKKRAEK